MSAPPPPLMERDGPGLAELASWALATPAGASRRLLIGAALALVGLLGLIVVTAGAMVATGRSDGGAISGCVPDAPLDPGGAAGPASGPVTPEQRGNATVIVSVGRGLSVPDRGLQIALATALQESGLRNLDHGDRDSLGLFQQRPSAGWGSPTQLQDPSYAAGAFFRHLLAVPAWQSLSLPQAAQAVQRSAFPDAYARWASLAANLLASLGGVAPTPTPCQSVAPAAPGADSAAATPVLAFAHAQLGKPYLWGATGPNAYDCSGLTLASWRAGGVMLPRTAAQQAAGGPHVPLPQAQPGDLLFWSATHAERGIYHVALYLGAGQILDAPDTAIPVRIRPVGLPGPDGRGGERDLMPFAVRPATAPPTAPVANPPVFPLPASAAQPA